MVTFKFEFTEVNCVGNTLKLSLQNKVLVCKTMLKQFRNMDYNYGDPQQVNQTLTSYKILK